MEEKLDKILSQLENTNEHISKSEMSPVKRKVNKLEQSNKQRG